LLVVAVVNVYEIEGQAFSRVMTLVAAGFVVTMLLPLAYRLPFFALLSLAGILWVLGPTDGAWLLALGFSLIGIAHLPIPMVARVGVLLFVAGVFAALRAGTPSTPWSSAVWPILGSMFMFRMVLYLRAIAAGQAPRDVWGVLAYFYMLPNVAFPLFPVIDYQNFGRTHYDREARAIYEQGMLWISRGLLHLVLYRFVYFQVLNDPVDVVDLSDLVRYMLGTFLLYLRVSGQFHLIVGVLHLFGFRLPETHKLYYLAHSFTELWRRINIYWTDFMMKAVFYPLYFKVKRLGPVRSLVLATAGVFFTTWALHSYQWFWLRGGFPLTGPDVLFWGILGALVIRGAVKELKSPKAPRQSAGVWSWRMGLKAAVTFSIFCFLWSLWSSESIGQWVWLLGAAGNVDAAGVLLSAGVFIAILLLGGWNWEIRRASSPRWLELARLSSVRTLAPLIGLLALAQPVVQGAVSTRVGDTLRALQTTNLNARDAALRHRGYYEQLDVRGQLNALNTADRAPPEWQTPADAGVIRERSDHLTRDLYPSRSVVWNGNVFSTNELGMRDREYAVQKPANTFRIALLGPSHVMGNGVADDETFETLLEARMNREQAAKGRNVEILNFGVDGYPLPAQLAILEDRALDFSPDMIILTNYHEGNLMTERYLLKVLNAGVRLPDEGLQALLDAEGLPEGFRGSLPVPYEWARGVVRWLGFEPRMLDAEAGARVRRITDPINDRAIARIAEIGRAKGIQVVVLFLDVVVDNAPHAIPNQAAVEAEALPILNLFDVFPPERRTMLRVAPWDDHPNAEGHRLIADRLYEELMPLMPVAPVPPIPSPATLGGA
jgi:D-alanyl-lipoteichoic acid acyltransferase DltB (MBOAT superfamily)